MLLNTSQNQHYSFSLALSLNCFFHPQFIPHHGTDLSFSKTHGHLHPALLQHYYFQTPALGTKGLMRSEETPSPSRDIRRVLMYV